MNRVASKNGISRNASRSLYAICLALCLAVAVPSWAQTFTTLHAFIGPEGKTSFATLAQGRDGALYGTASTGGPNDMGVVFRIDTAGHYSVLHAFSGPDGQSPQGGLLLGADGNFYGTTYSGGSNGEGVIYKMTPGGRVTVILNLGGSVGASYPQQPPIIGTDGNFYGVAYGSVGGSGQLYKLEPSGNLTVILSSSNLYGPVQTADGLLYVAFIGVDEYGGVARISTTGSDYEAFYFDGTNGAYSFGISLGLDGTAYGTASEGGTNNSGGDLFRFDNAFNFEVLHEFSSFPGDGQTPAGAPLPANDGKLYGTSYFGGTTGDGVIYNYASDGTVTTVYSFDNGQYGTVSPIGQPFQHTSGVFYGTTLYGGPRALNGQIYSLDNSLGPFITFVVPQWRVGQTIQILGQGLTGTTGVTFKGIPAGGFSIVSDTYMTAVVPGGATNGPVVVTTPTGTLNSNKNFRVLH